MVARAGAGPEPIPHKQLTAENLALAILDALSPTALDRARELGESIQHEKGCEMGAESFHAQMGVDALRCSLLPERVAIWHLKGSKIRLSSLAATVLGNEGLIKFNDLRLYVDLHNSKFEIPNQDQISFTRVRHRDGPVGSSFWCSLRRPWLCSQLNSSLLESAYWCRERDCGEETGTTGINAELWIHELDQEETSRNTTFQLDSGLV